MKFLLLSLIGLFSLVSTFSSAANKVSVSTYQWLPYIEKADQPLGTAAELLSQIVSQEDISLDWRHQNYDLAFELIAQGKQQAGFPFFKTSERAERVLFSQPIFSVTNRIYYNRQREKQLNVEQLAQLTQHKFGRVAGYSYGEKIDTYLVDATVFASEPAALEALLAHQIDFLPMTESVMNTLLNQKFKDQSLLIETVAGVVGHDSLHLIAPKNEQGQQLISKIDRMVAQVKDIESLSLKVVERDMPKDIARLITAEGYPAIVGQTSLNQEVQYYTLPQGTRVLVLKWSDKIRTASQTDRIYKSMIDLSQVVVLNGPHVGKELYIKNMHLEIQ